VIKIVFPFETPPAWITPPQAVRTYTDKLLIPETFLVHKPDSLSWEEASSIWMQYLTAWGGVIHAGGVSKGKTILITAASSSVGLACELKKFLESEACPYMSHIWLDCQSEESILHLLDTDENDRTQPG
jgi:hypothetical protein